MVIQSFIHAHPQTTARDVQCQEAEAREVVAAPNAVKNGRGEYAVTMVGIPAQHHAPAGNSPAAVRTILALAPMYVLTAYACHLKVWAATIATKARNFAAAHAYPRHSRVATRSRIQAVRENIVVLAEPSTAVAAVVAAAVHNGTTVVRPNAQMAKYVITVNVPSLTNTLVTRWPQKALLIPI